MFRKIIAGTAVAGALSLGLAGMAGAATTNTPSSSGTPSAALCAKAAKVEARIQTWESKVNARLPKAEAREAAAKAAGHTKVATFIANRITKVQARETKVNARLAKIEAKCGTTGGTDSTGSAGGTVG
jgi:hypothetical protein